MAGHRRAGPTRNGSEDVDDGTLCRSKTPEPGPLGLSRSSTTLGKKRIKIFALDGAKVHDYLFHVALSEIQWQELNARPHTNMQAAVQRQRAMDRGSILYDRFLEACSRGPGETISFLTTQHDLQKDYLLKSQTTLHTLQLEAARRQVLLSEVVFAAQTVKSAATAGAAIIGMLLTGPEILAGAGIALGFDVTMEIINRIGGTGESDANTVVVGFKQTVANDAVTVAGASKQTAEEATKGLLQKTLSYPMKSSTYRSALSTAAHLDSLLNILGTLCAAVTLYTEFGPSKAAFSEMQRARNSYRGLDNIP
jgi:hypothetical protein